MNKNRRRHVHNRPWRRATLLLAGAALLGIEGTCMPKNYFYNLGGQARNSLFNNLSELLVQELFDAINLPDVEDPDDSGGDVDPDDSPSPIG